MQYGKCTRMYFVSRACKDRVMKSARGVGDSVEGRLPRDLTILQHQIWPRYDKHNLELLVSIIVINGSFSYTFVMFGYKLNRLGVFI